MELIDNLFVADNVTNLETVIYSLRRDIPVLRLYCIVYFADRNRLEILSSRELFTPRYKGRQGVIAGIANEKNAEEKPQEVRMEEQQETPPVEEQTEMQTERENDMEEETDNETEKGIQSLSELSVENRRIVEDALNDKFQEAINNRIDFIDEEAIEYSITSENASFDNFTINSNMSRVSRYSGDLYVPFSVDINDWKNYWDNTDFNEEMYTKSYQNVTGYFLVHGLEVMSNGMLSEYSIDISSLYQDEKEMKKLFLEE